MATRTHKAGSLVLACLSLSLGWAAGCGPSDPPADPCSQLSEAPPLTGSAEPCRYWIAPPGNPCPAVPKWVANPLYGPASDAIVHCRYEWGDPNSAPSAADVAAVPSAWSSDCAYVTPQAQADDVARWARESLRAAAGQPLAPSESADVGVIVLDTVPEGESPPPHEAQHGQTLAWMISDLSCEIPGNCPIQIKKAMAMPRLVNAQTGQPTVSPDGGAFGILSDVADALWAAARAYRQDLRAVALGQKPPTSVPVRAVVVSAFGYDNHGSSTLCDTAPSASSNRAVVAMHEAYEAAACLGMLHVAAAGNSDGGASGGQGLLCPARWDHAVSPTEPRCAALWGAAEWALIQEQHAALVEARYPGMSVPLIASSKLEDPTDALLSVGGVDYHGSPLVLSRPGACAEAVAIGLGGLGWVDDAVVPPALFGTSVSAAVAGARLAVRWRDQLDHVSGDLGDRVLGDSNPVSFSRPGSCNPPTPVSCPSTPWIAEPPSPVARQNPEMPEITKDLLRSRAGEGAVDPPGEAVCVQRIPHCVRPSIAATSDVWPQPVEPVCVKCGVLVEPIDRGYPELWLDGNTALTGLVSAALIVEDVTGQVVLTKSIDPAAVTRESTIVLSDVRASIFMRATAWISVYLADGRTLSQQIFVIE
jgi:hypothetical protein